MKFGKFGEIDNYDVIVTSYIGYLYFMLCMKLDDTMVPNNHTVLRRLFLKFTEVVGSCNKPPLVNR